MSNPTILGKCITISRASEIAKKLLFEMNQFATEDERDHIESHPRCCSLIAGQMGLSVSFRERKSESDYEAQILRRIRNQSSKIAISRSSDSQLILPETRIISAKSKCLTAEECEDLNSQWIGGNQVLTIERAEEVVHHLRIDRCISCNNMLLELPHISVVSMDCTSLDVARYVETHIQYN